jgi:hypothetical protein
MIGLISLADLQFPPNKSRGRMVTFHRLKLFTLLFESDQRKGPTNTILSDPLSISFEIRHMNSAVIRGKTVEASCSIAA